MARRRLEGLERVLGANALFSTAYGNVGSSIYYALGLVASFALGLTPIVFIITGFFFFCTAATYAEATTMYPEAGGSSSFARRAFNEFWSFVAAWAQMLTYIATIAISAFFVPHYIGGLFWEPLRSSPGDIIAGCCVIAVLAAINVFGAKESTGVNILLAVVDFATQLLLVLVGVFLVFSPEVLVDNVILGVAPEWKDFVLAIPIGMLAYTGIETISNMSEEARDEAKTIPTAINRVRIAVFAIYFTLPAVALSALPVTFNEQTGEYQTLLGLTEEEGGFAGDPILGVVKAIDLGPLQSIGEIYVGLLAATILFLATNAGIIGVSRLVYSMGIHRQLPDALRSLHPRFRTPWVGILVFSAFAILVDPAGPGGVPRRDLLVRRAAVVHDGPRGRGAAADQAAGLPALVPRARQPDRSAACDLPLFAVVGGTLHGDRLRGDRRPQRPRGRRRRRLARARDRHLRRVPPPPRARPGLHRQGRDPAAGRRPRGRVRLRARPARRRHVRRARDGDRGQARRAQAARDPRAGHGHGAERAGHRRRRCRRTRRPPTR